MTYLIVDLAPARDPLRLMGDLYHEVGVRWFKVDERAALSPIGHVALTARDLAARPDLYVFADFKLAHPRFTVADIVGRLADLGVAAVSTFTPAATEAAVRAAEGSPLRVWMVHKLSDEEREITRIGVFSVVLSTGAHGVIFPASDVAYAIPSGFRGAVVVPGVRLIEDAVPDRFSGHIHCCTPSQVRASGATHAVVGRPIALAADLVAAARAYLAALR